MFTLKERQAGRIAAELAALEVAQESSDSITAVIESANDKLIEQGVDEESRFGTLIAIIVCPFINFAKTIGMNEDAALEVIKNKLGQGRQAVTRFFSKEQNP